MRFKGSKGVLSILLLVSIILSSLVPLVAAKPVVPSPANNFWPGNASWGTNIRFENVEAATISEIWWGVGTSDVNVASPPDPPSGIIVEFLDADQNVYANWVHQAVAEPASYSWQVQFRKVQNANPNGGKVSSTMGDSENNYVPPDFSVVIENTDLGIHINLRAGPENIHGANIRTTPITANLYVDNAVNIQSIDNLDPLSGKPGDNLRLNVFVKNTGRYTDNYVVSTGGSLDPTILNLAPDSTENVILNTTLPTGTQSIVVTAAGNYATDQSSITATGIMAGGVDVQIHPSINFGENGGILAFNVIINNNGDFQDSYTITASDNAIPSWSPTLDNYSFDNVLPGENRTTTLRVTIPNNANPGDSDNMTVTVTSVDNSAVSDNASCIARAVLLRAEVTILENIQESMPGGTLNYTVMVANKGDLDDSYNLTFTDNIDGSNYWENTISFDAPSLAVQAGNTGTTTLRVMIPENAIPGTDDNITVTATSQTDNRVDNIASCIAHVAIVRGVQVRITPPAQENENGGTLNYTVTVKNNGDLTENFLLIMGDNAGWALSLDTTSLLIPNGENRTTKLAVTIPNDAIAGAIDSIWVQATSIDNAGVFDNESCLAQAAIARGVQVLIDPSPPVYLENEYGGTVKFTVTVVNLGIVQENFQLTKGDNSGWGLSLDDNWLVVPSGENRTTTLTVTIPSPGAKIRLVAGWNLVCFTAVGQSDTPSSIFAGLSYFTDYYLYYWTAPNGPYVIAGLNDPLKDNVGYWVWIDQNKTLTTTGEPPASRDTRLVSGWNLAGFPATNENTTSNKIFTGLSYFTDYFLYYWSAPGGPYGLVGQNDALKDNRGYWVWIDQNKTVTGSAVIPTSENVWVQATSKDDPSVLDNESGLAHLEVFVPLHGVQVAISPPNQENVGGGTLLYNVIINNTGNVQENFLLTKGDNAAWTLNLDSASLLIPAGENGSVTLAVTIPNGTSGSTIDNIWVRATSKDNATVFDNESCLARVKIVRGVQTAITPTFQENDVGGTLTYAVTVTNLSNVQENFQLTKGDNAGWTLSTHDNWLLVQKGGNAQTNLTVTIPNDALGGTLDDIWVQAMSKDNAAVADNESCEAHVRVMAIMITPVFQENTNGGNLTYTATVTNRGPQENFLLSKGDVDGWTLNLDRSSLLIPQGENGTTKLTVTIPSGALGDTFDNIWIQATSNDDPTVFDNNSCLAHVLITTAVEVHVTPNIQENVQGENTTFTITVMNRGNVPGGFDLYWSDTENWGDNISLLSTTLQIDVGGEGSTSLLVHIPDNANPGTIDNITVTATSQEDAGVASSDICAVNVVFSRQVSVSISPAENGIIPGGTLTYTVIVRNIGDNSDNYFLEASDNLGWSPTLSENLLENLAPGGTRIIGLKVTVPSDADSGAEDNVIVTATSLTNENFTDSEACIARSIAIIRGVGVTISPSGRDGMQGETLNFTVIIKNLGNVDDNYNLTLTDNASWNPSISDGTVEIPVGDNRSVTLSVMVPDNAAPQTMDKITVTVFSQVNPSVSNSASCQITALILRGVMITISPDYGTGPAGTVLNYTVKITNTGRATDNYSLVVSGTTGWRTSILPSSLILAPGDSGEATLTITVPSDSDGNSMIFYVWAISSADTSVRNNATCRAVSLANSGGGGEAGLSWIEIILIAAIIVAAVFVAGYLTRKRNKEKPRRAPKVLSLS